MQQEERKFTNLNLLRGIRVAEVVSSADPKLQERLLVRVIGVHNLQNKSVDNGVWAHHCAPTSTGAGDLPEPGDYVYVMFPDTGNPMAIIWLGFVRSSFQDLLDPTDFLDPDEIDSITKADEILPNSIL